MHYKEPAILPSGEPPVSGFPLRYLASLRLCGYELQFLGSMTAAGQSSTPITPDTVVVSNGNLRLKALLWKPAGSGPFPAVLFSHGAGRADPSRAQLIGPIFARHGYVFLYLFRRGHGLSATEGAFIGDVLKQEAAANGEKARSRLHLVLLTTDHSDDVNAGLLFLKHLAAVDPGRVAVAGHSFGGQLALLAAERDSSIRAAVTFAAAAALWQSSADLRERLLTAARNIRVPVFLHYAANDYSTAPGRVIAAEMARLNKPHQLKISQAVGETSAAGHAALYADIVAWEHDVFKFLDEHVRR